MAYVKDIDIGMKKKYSTEERKKNSDLIEEERKKDSKLVKGVFKNLECPGGDVEFAFKQYKGEPIRKYRFLDGEEAEIPLGVAKHINQCKYKRSKHLVDVNGNKMIGADKPVERYQFVSTDYR